MDLLLKKRRKKSLVFATTSIANFWTASLNSYWLPGVLVWLLSSWSLRSESENVKSSLGSWNQMLAVIPCSCGWKRCPTIERRNGWKKVGEMEFDLAITSWRSRRKDKCLALFATRKITMRNMMLRPFIHLSSHSHTHIHIYTHNHTHMYTGTRVYTHITHARTHTHTHTHTHARTHRQSSIFTASTEDTKIAYPYSTPTLTLYPPSISSVL